MYKDVKVVGLFSLEHYFSCLFYNLLNTIVYTGTVLYTIHYTLLYKVDGVEAFLPHVYGIEHYIVYYPEHFIVHCSQ